MVIRAALDADIPAIVELLKSSLGESLMAKSITYWNWKHRDNPFGVSPVLVAEVDGKLAGVRAFMRWGWQGPHANYKAVRAVDTATHPEYQGKGIFKKLTLQLVAQCQQGGDHLVFNTPNTQSRPGYLKMGWEDAGRVPVQFYPLRPVAMASAALFRKNAVVASAKPPLSALLEEADIPALLKQDQEIRSGIHTQYSREYLDWRYVKVPVATYTGCRVRLQGKDALIIGRMKMSRLGNEFRVTDLFSNERHISGPVKKELRAFATRLGADYITCSGAIESRISIGVRLRLGPIATVRALSLTDLTDWKHFKAWSPSLGDLELF